MAMDGLTLFGLASVTVMLVCYALEARHHLYVLGFAVSCATAALYAYLQGAWPFAGVETVFAAVALDRWRKRVWR